MSGPDARHVNAASAARRTRGLPPGWDPSAEAVVVCDMWDAHHCVSAARRAAEMTPRVQEVLTGSRDAGALVVHAPAGCMAFYRGTPPRRRALRAAHATAPCRFDWNGWEPDELADLPGSLTNPGGCSCDAAEPCGVGGPPYPWTRQVSSITVAPDDAVTDDGQELYNLLAHRAVRDVVVLGVHANLCVLGRPYGIRQLVYAGPRPLLCRDRTDAFHRDPRGHAWGTDRVVAHVEQRWCPTVTSGDLLGGAPLRLERGGR